MDFKDKIENPYENAPPNSIHFHMWNGQQVNVWSIFDEAIEACQKEHDEEMGRIRRKSADVVKTVIEISEAKLQQEMGGLFEELERDYCKMHDYIYLDKFQYKSLKAKYLRGK